MTRVSRDLTYLHMATAFSKRATCARRQVGCILVDELGVILASGYNGVARGLIHCIDEHCPGVNKPSGEGLDTCEAIHAEQNALLQCSDVMMIKTAYCTTAPCITCTKLLMNTSCSEIIFTNPYSQASAQDLWKKTGRVWQQMGNNGFSDMGKKLREDAVT